MKITDWRVVIVVAVCITLIEIVALLKGVNGIVLTSVIAVLAGLGGWHLPRAKS